MLRKKRLILKSIAATLCVVFISSELRAAPVEPIQNQAAQDRILSQPQLLETPIDFVSLAELHAGQNGKFIIHIQDAHSNYSAQDNMASAMRELMRKYGIQLVLSEGGYGDCSLSELRDKAKPELVDRVARNFLRSGEIHGEEYLNLTDKRPMTIIGIEDKALYDEGLRYYEQLADKREKVLGYLVRSRNAIEKLKTKLYPKELVEYERVGQARQNREWNIEEFLRLADKTGVDLSRFSELVKLSEIKLSEDAIDFESANLEQSVLIEELFKRGAKETLESYLAKMKQMKGQASGGKVAQFAYFEKTLSIAKEKGIETSKFPNFLAYVQYLKQFSSLDFDVLLREFDEAEDELYKKILGSESGVRSSESPDDAFLLRAVDRFVLLLQTAHQIQMTADQFALFKYNEPDFSTEAMQAFLNRKLAEQGYFEDIIPYEPLLEDARKTLDLFYDSVKRRDTVFMKNLEMAMSAEDQKIAFLIAGGYHTPHLKELLRERGYGYSVLAPIVATETDQKKYESLLLGKGAPTKKKVRSVSGESKAMDKPLGALDDDLAKLIKKKDKMRTPMARVNSPVGSRLAAELGISGASIVAQGQRSPVAQAEIRPFGYEPQDVSGARMSVQADDPQVARRSLMTGARQRIEDFLKRPGMMYATVTMLTTIILGTTGVAGWNQLIEANAYSKGVAVLLIGFSPLFIYRALVSYVGFVWAVFLDAPQVEPEPYSMYDEDLPKVTVQIAIRNEPFNVVRMTLDSALAIQYPADKFEIQVIDNSSDAEGYERIQRYAEQNGVVFIHRDGTEGFKAGNLNIGMAQAKGDLFLVLDADSTVRPDVLLRSLPEFKNKDLGYVQFKVSTTNGQYNGLANMIGLGGVTHSRQMKMRNTQGFISFDGHNGIVSRAALEAVGGWQEAVSEDLKTAIMIRLAGFKGKYLSYIETGEWAPVSLQELKKQRRKWATGTMEVFYEMSPKIIVSKNFKWYEKVDLLFRMTYSPLSSVAYLLAFYYIQYPLFVVAGILALSYGSLIYSTLTTSKRQPLSMFLRSLFVFSSVVPDTAFALIGQMTGKKLIFDVTFKGKTGPTGLAAVVYNNYASIIMGIFYFLGGFLIHDGNYLTFIKATLPATIGMFGSIVNPFIIPSMEKNTDAVEVSDPVRHTGVVYEQSGRVGLITWRRNISAYRDVHDFISEQDIQILRNGIRERKDELKVAIVVPTYNSASYISGTLERYYEQVRQAASDHPGWSLDLVISVNGLQTEGVVEAVRNFQRSVKDERIQVVLLELKGFQSKVPAMNAGAAYAQSTRADVLGFIDDDIQYGPGTLSKTVSYLIEHPEAYLVGPQGGPVRTPSQNSDPFRRLEDLFSQDSILPMGSGQYMLAATYPMIPDEIVADDSYVNMYFMSSDKNIDRTALVPGVSGRFKLTGDLDLYLKRFIRTSMAIRQLRDLFPENDKYTRLLGYFNAKPMTKRASLGDTLRSMAVLKKVQTMYLIGYIVAARAAISIWTDMKILSRSMAGQPIYKTGWYAAPSTKVASSDAANGSGARLGARLAKETGRTDWALVGVTTAAFLARMTDLGYNGPMIDESFYSVAKDFGNVFYITGDSRLWPVISYYSHALGGVIAARAVAAAFGTMTVFAVYQIAKHFAQKLKPSRQITIAFLSALAFSVSAPAVFVSKLATYDSMSFMLYAIGFWQMIRAIELKSTGSAILSATALTAAAATRFFTVGMLPLAVLWAWWMDERGDKRELVVQFTGLLVMMFGAYWAFNSEHVMASIANARSLGVLLAGSETREHVLGRIFMDAAPIVLMGSTELLARLREGISKPANRSRAFIFLLAASAMVPMYHLMNGNSYTMEKNLAAGTMFGAILSGFYLERIREWVARKSHSPTISYILASVLALSLFTTAYPRIKKYQAWPDWTPVISSAQEIIGTKDVRIWSTASTGGSGNVWQLRSALGPRVDNTSPWLAPTQEEVLHKAASEGVDFVIGPLEGIKLKVGDLRDGYLVRRVIDVSGGPEVFIFELSRISGARLAQDGPQIYKLGKDTWVTFSADDARLTVEGANFVTNSVTYEFKEGQILSMGRDRVGEGRPDEMHLMIMADGTVSRKHAEVTYLSGQFFIRDVGSKYGTRRDEVSIAADEERTVGEWFPLFLRAPQGLSRGARLSSSANAVAGDFESELDDIIARAKRLMYGGAKERVDKAAEVIRNLSHDDFEVSLVDPKPGQNIPSVAWVELAVKAGDRAKVFVLRDLVDILDDAELLAVIGHEVAHHMNRDYQFRQNIVRARKKYSQDLLDVIYMHQEIEADKGAIEFLRRAGAGDEGSVISMLEKAFALMRGQHAYVVETHMDDMRLKILRNRQTQGEGISEVVFPLNVAGRMIAAGFRYAPGDSLDDSPRRADDIMMLTEMIVDGMDFIFKVLSDGDRAERAIQDRFDKKLKDWGWSDPNKASQNAQDRKRLLEIGVELALVRHLKDYYANGPPDSTESRYHRDLLDAYEEKFATLLDSMLYEMRQAGTTRFGVDIEFPVEFFMESIRSVARVQRVTQTKVPTNKELDEWMKKWLQKPFSPDLEPLKKFYEIKYDGTYTSQKRDRDLKVLPTAQTDPFADMWKNFLPDAGDRKIDPAKIIRIPDIADWARKHFEGRSGEDEFVSMRSMEPIQIVSEHFQEIFLKKSRWQRAKEFLAALRIIFMILPILVPYQHTHIVQHPVTSLVTTVFGRATVYDPYESPQIGITKDGQRFSPTGEKHAIRVIDNGELRLQEGGMVAVDPSVFDLGSDLRIELSDGRVVRFTVSDIGGKVRREMVNLSMSDVSSASLSRFEAMFEGAKVTGAKGGETRSFIVTFDRAKMGSTQVDEVIGFQAESVRETEWLFMPIPLLLIRKRKEADLGDISGSRLSSGIVEWFRDRRIRTGYLKAGDRIGPYTILRLVRQGGMGAVYEAVDGQGEHYAFKTDVLVRPFLSFDPLYDAGKFTRKKNLENEIYWLQQLNAYTKTDAEKSFFPVYVASGKLSPIASYMVTTFVSDPTLRDVMRDEAKRNAGLAKMDVERAAKITMDLLDALTVAHRAGVVHNDIKPDNVFVREDESGPHVRLHDFGIATHRTFEGEPMKVPAAWNYATPEILEGVAPGVSSDVYQAGLLLFELLYGASAYSAKEETYKNQDGYDSLVLSAAWPMGVKEVIWKALKKDPKDRFGSATEMKQALQNALSLDLPMEGFDVDEMGYASDDHFLDPANTRSKWIKTWGSPFVPIRVIKPFLYRERATGHLYFSYRNEPLSGPIRLVDTQEEIDRKLRLESEIYKKAAMVGIRNIVRTIRVGNETLTRIAETYSDEEMVRDGMRLEDLLITTLYFVNHDMSRYSPEKDIHEPQNVYVRRVDGRDYYLAFDMADSKSPRGISRPLSQEDIVDFADDILYDAPPIDRAYLDSRIDALSLDVHHKGLLRDAINAVLSQAGSRLATATESSPGKRRFDESYSAISQMILTSRYGELYIKAKLYEQGVYDKKPNNSAGTMEHEQRVAENAVKIAHVLGIDGSQLVDLAFAASVHDIGKTEVPPGILTKEAKLTDEENLMMQNHVSLGVDRLRGLGVSEDIISIVGQHHEYLNGTGYPNRLKGDQISMLSRVLIVADVFTALTERRAYREPQLMSSADAFSLIVSGKGDLYDARVVEALGKVLGLSGSRLSTVDLGSQQGEIVIDTTEDWQVYRDLAKEVSASLVRANGVLAGRVSSSAIEFVIKHGLFNAVVHGNDFDESKKIRLSWVITNDKLTLKIADEGTRPIGTKADFAVIDGGQIISGLGEAMDHMRSLFDIIDLKPVTDASGAKIGGELTAVKYLGARLAKKAKAQKLPTGEEREREIRNLTSTLEELRREWDRLDAQGGSSTQQAAVSQRIGEVQARLRLLEKRAGARLAGIKIVLTPDAAQMVDSSRRWFIRGVAAAVIGGAATYALGPLLGPDDSERTDDVSLDDADLEDFEKQALRGDLGELDEDAIDHESLRRMVQHYKGMVEFLRDSEAILYPGVSEKERAQRIAHLSFAALFLTFLENPTFKPVQMADGPAAGPFQIEPQTAADVFREAENRPMDHPAHSLIADIINGQLGDFYSLIRATKFNTLSQEETERIRQSISSSLPLQRVLWRLFILSRMEPSAQDVQGDPGQKDGWPEIHLGYNTPYEMRTARPRNDGEASVPLRRGLATRFKAVAAKTLVARLLEDPSRLDTPEFEGVYVGLLQDYYQVENINKFLTRALRMVRNAESLLDNTKKKIQRRLTTLQRRNSSRVVNAQIRRLAEEDEIRGALEALSVMKGYRPKQYTDGEWKELIEEAQTAVDEVVQAKSRVKNGLERLAPSLAVPIRRRSGARLALAPIGIELRLVAGHLPLPLTWKLSILDAAVSEFEKQRTPTLEFYERIYRFMAADASLVAHLNAQSETKPDSTVFEERMPLFAKVVGQMTMEASSIQQMIRHGERSGYVLRRDLAGESWILQRVDLLGSVMGFVRFRFDAESVALYIENKYVHPKYRNQHVYQDLMSVLLEDKPIRIYESLDEVSLAWLYDSLPADVKNIRYPTAQSLTQRFKQGTTAYNTAIARLVLAAMKKPAGASAMQALMQDAEEESRTARRDGRDLATIGKNFIPAGKPILRYPDVEYRIRLYPDHGNVWLEARDVTQAQPGLFDRVIADTAEFEEWLDQRSELKLQSAEVVMFRLYYMKTGELPPDAWVRRSVSDLRAGAVSSSVISLFIESLPQLTPKPENVLTLYESYISEGIYIAFLQAGLEPDLNGYSVIEAAYQGSKAIFGPLSEVHAYWVSEIVRLGLLSEAEALRWFDSVSEKGKTIDAQILDKKRALVRAEYGSKELKKGLEKELEKLRSEKDEYVWEAILALRKSDPLVDQKLAEDPYDAIPFVAASVSDADSPLHNAFYVSLREKSQDSKIWTRFFSSKNYSKSSAQRPADATFFSKSLTRILEQKAGARLASEASEEVDRFRTKIHKDISSLAELTSAVDGILNRIWQRIGLDHPNITLSDADLDALRSLRSKLLQYHPLVVFSLRVMPQDRIVTFNFIDLKYINSKIGIIANDLIISKRHALIRAAMQRHKLIGAEEESLFDTYKQDKYVISRATAERLGVKGIESALSLVRQEVLRELADYAMSIYAEQLEGYQFKMLVGVSAPVSNNEDESKIYADLQSGQSAKEARRMLENDEASSGVFVYDTFGDQEANALIEARAEEAARLRAELGLSNVILGDAIEMPSDQEMMEVRGKSEEQIRATGNRRLISLKKYLDLIDYFDYPKGWIDEEITQRNKQYIITKISDQISRAIQNRAPPLSSEQFPDSDPDWSFTLLLRQALSFLRTNLKQSNITSETVFHEESMRRRGVFISYDAADFYTNTMRQMAIAHLRYVNDARRTPMTLLDHVLAADDNVKRMMIDKTAHLIRLVNKGGDARLRIPTIPVIGLQRPRAKNRAYLATREGGDEAGVFVEFKEGEISEEEFEVWLSGIVRSGTALNGRLTVSERWDGQSKNYASIVAETVHPYSERFVAAQAAELHLKRLMAQSGAASNTALIQVLENKQGAPTKWKFFYMASDGTVRIETQTYEDLIKGARLSSNDTRRGIPLKARTAFAKYLREPYDAIHLMSDDLIAINGMEGLRNAEGLTKEQFFDLAAQKAVSVQRALARLKQGRASVVALPIGPSQMLSLIDSPIERDMAIVEKGENKLMIVAPGVPSTDYDHVFGMGNGLGAGQAFNSPFLKFLTYEGHSHPRFKSSDPSEGDLESDREKSQDFRLGSFIVVKKNVETMDLSIRDAGNTDYRSYSGEAAIDTLADIGILTRGSLKVGARLSDSEASLGDLIEQGKVLLIHNTARSKIYQSQLDPRVFYKANETNDPLTDERDNILAMRASSESLAAVMPEVLGMGEYTGDDILDPAPFKWHWLQLRMPVETRALTAQSWATADSYLRKMQFTLMVAEHLQQMHASGWVHGDVKPDNFVIDDTGRGYLIDFQYSKNIGSPLGTLSRAASQAFLSRFTEVSEGMFELDRSGLMTEPYQDIVAFGYSLDRLFRREALVKLGLRELISQMTLGVDDSGIVRPGQITDMAAVIGALKETIRRLESGTISESELPVLEDFSTDFIDDNSSYMADGDSGARLADRERTLQEGRSLFLNDARLARVIDGSSLSRPDPVSLNLLAGIRSNRAYYFAIPSAGAVLITPNGPSMALMNNIPLSLPVFAPTQAVVDTTARSNDSTVKDYGSTLRTGLRALTSFSSEQPVLIMRPVDMNAVEPQHIKIILETMRERFGNVYFEFTDSSTGERLTDISSDPASIPANVQRVVLAEATGAHIQDAIALKARFVSTEPAEVRGGEVGLIPIAASIVAAVIVGRADNISGHDLAVQFFRRLTRTTFAQEQYDLYIHPSVDRQQDLDRVSIKALARVAIAEVLTSVRQALQAISQAA